MAQELGDREERSAAAPLRVAVVARELMQRQALHQLIRQSPALQLATSGATIAQLDAQAAIDALLLHPGTPPEFALIDLALATEQPLVVLLDRVPAEIAESLLRAGASVLSAGASPSAFAAALHCAAAGLVALDPTYAISVRPRTAPDLVEPLTAREREVLALLANGLANRDIAGALAISTHTAKYHVAQVLAKLRADSRAHAVAIALREGLVAVDAARPPGSPEATSAR